eukprot:CAMPEP_0174230978 /NCGR_PEP_ID=MMETSP0417-20130205/1610_1 /TAXON_ID=242541 /ORGANISM="Mayorella sp, Strain BSH-02190019" /LENGTH=355 /DNA_ID=CAMNT_0015308761 /DNA_START=156 /DNA_END=1219 /DNA_ORIENTATION=-
MNSGQLPFATSDTAPLLVRCCDSPSGAGLVAVADRFSVSVLQPTTRSSGGTASGVSSTDLMALDFDCLGGLFPGVRARSLAWSPLTVSAVQSASSFESSPPLSGGSETQSVHTRLSLCVGGHDTLLHYLAWETDTVVADPTLAVSSSSDATSTAPLTSPVLQTSLVLSGHRSAPIQCNFHPRTDRLTLASIADDLTAKVWDLTTQQITAEFFTAYSPVAVQWHPSEPEQLMVAHAGGEICIQDLRSNRVALRMHAPSTAPLSSVDWCVLDSLRVGAASGSEWFVWDLSSSSDPLQARVGHGHSAQHFRWSNTHANVFATAGSSNLKVWDQHRYEMPLSVSLNSWVGSLSWMPTSP